MHEVGNRAVNSDSVLANTILYIFPARFTKISTVGTQNITIFGQAIDDSWIGHFMWRIKNLKVCKRTVNILYGKRLVTELDNIFPQEIFFELSTSECKDNLSR